MREEGARRDRWMHERRVFVLRERGIGRRGSKEGVIREDGKEREEGGGRCRKE